MTELRVPLDIVGTTFSAYEFEWNWRTSQLLARATGCSIRNELDLPRLKPDSSAAGHPMVPFNGALLARNRDEVMDRLIGGYRNWEQVGRWGSGAATFLGAVPRAGRGTVSSHIAELGATSKGHALVRFNFEVVDADSDAPLLEGWMLLFLLGSAPEGAGGIAPPPIVMPERPADEVVVHDTPMNVTFDWAISSGDWNKTHFVPQQGSSAPLTHGPRNMGLVISDACRVFAQGDVTRLRSVTIGSIPAPHYPPEPTKTHFWREANRVLGRLTVPAAARLDGGQGEKVCVDQIEMLF